MTTSTHTEAAVDAHGHIVSIWSHHDGSYGGISPVYDGEFARTIARHGHAITVVSSLQPTAHRVSGCGVGHDDAVFCEAGTSFAAYLENGEAFGGRWWETDSRCVRRDYGLDV
jgi:hypothetical protein